MDKIEKVLIGEERRLFEYRGCLSRHLKNLQGKKAKANAIGFIKKILDRKEWPPQQHFKKIKTVKGTNIWEMRTILKGVHYRYICYCQHNREYILVVKVFTHEEMNKKFKPDAIKKWNDLGLLWYREIYEDD